MTIDIERLAATTRDLAHRLKIDQFDLYGSSVDSTSVKVDHGQPEQIKAANQAAITVRVWNADRRVGITSTTDLDPVGLELALKTALEASEFGPTDHSPEFSPLARSPIAALTGANQEPGAAAAPIPELLAVLVEAEARFLAADPAIVAVPYNNLAQRATERFYLNSDGASRYETGSYTSIYLVSKTEQADRKPRSAGAVRLAHSLAKLDVEGCVQEAIEKTLSHLNYQPIASGSYTVVFSGEAFLSLLSGFSNLFNAQSILDKQSLSTPESIGQAIASPLLSLYDDSLHPDNVGISYFDGEGTPCQRVALLEAGVIQGFLHSAGTAKRLNATPTGHANMGVKVTVSPSFYHVVAAQPPDRPYDLKTADRVILIDELHALHAGVKSLEGAFSLPFDGWVVEQGKRTSIESATVAGDIRDLLKAIVCVEAKPTIYPDGICPRVWVEGLSITGE